jgi:ubiquinone/menaquinone biosynthesis C-methylase UbiE
MLGVTSVNRCGACQRVHERWGRATGLRPDDLATLTVEQAAAYAYGQALAMQGPGGATAPLELGARHRGELEVAGMAMQLANLAGNRFLAAPGPRASRQVAGALIARIYDLGMRAADRAGLRRARERIASSAHGDILEIGIGTGLNLALYPVGATIQAIDPSDASLDVAARRADRLGRPVTLTAGDAADLPYPDGSFDVIVGTFVLCTVPDLGSVLSECRRVLRPGGALRFLEHGRSDRMAIARAQTWLAPAWARVAGGCRLDHDVRASIEAAGLRIVEERSRGTGLLVEVVATSA